MSLYIAGIEIYDQHPYKERISSISILDKIMKNRTLVGF